MNARHEASLLRNSRKRFLSRKLYLTPVEGVCALTPEFAGNNILVYLGFLALYAVTE